MNQSVDLALDDSHHPADMDDSREKTPPGQVLGRFLKDCQELVLPPFLEADRKARKFRHHYLWCAGIAAVSGTFTVWLAILQLYVAEPCAEWTTLGVLEATFAVITFLAVLVGMQFSWKKKWLNERFKAENLRLLKFRSLLDARRWNAEQMDPERVKQELRDKVSEAIMTAFPAMPRWLKERALPTVREPHRSLTEEQRDLVAYYWRQRLDFQRTYLSAAVQKYDKWNNITWLLGYALFFGSVAVVFVHAVAERFTPLPEAVLIAAALPVAGAGVRTYRAGTEAARNARRCEAAHQNLCELAARLRSAADADAHFWTLDCCEQALETDVHEWMRLMTEVEWFG